MFLELPEASSVKEMLVVGNIVYITEVFGY